MKNFKRFRSKSSNPLSMLGISVLQKSSNLSLSESSKVLFQNVDRSKFKDGITPMEVIDMVTWISSGCLKNNPRKSCEELLVEIEKYLGLLKEALYREGRT